MLPYILGLLVPSLFFIRWIRERKSVSDPSLKYVYITGCDTGFGNLLSKHLDQLGFRVIAGCYTEKGEDELKKAASDRLTTLPLDVSNADSVSKAADSIKALVGEKGLWAVVNNAGISLPSAPYDWLRVDDFRPMLEVNLYGVIAVTLSVLPLLKRARGRVVNVASVFGRVSPFGGPYCLSKYGVEAFNDSLRRNMAPFGVKVLCIEPGFFKTSVTDTSMILKNLNGLWNRLPQEVKDEYGSNYLDRVTHTLEDSLLKMLDSDLMKVVSCMTHAVSAAHPRTRYSPGWDAKFFWIPISYMPTFLQDRVLAKNAVRPALGSAKLLALK
ncbi:dehydrogenase/reductase SDR family member 9 [Engraulis encrasicolus]|uniref:dehydrogenase/reductase SDR family member 9 n=1 Tax=Engraulis encrasicolus TaxID=184585 RepID=UPI002FCE7288